ncbi:hypothetical protein K502DRAFT_366755 [Neoconidiobolus thromboides FSU 785]|nr:hypothetical protein K502DRAFT_366755 [Neoconidiobolus thromboides FSU 785]
MLSYEKFGTTLVKDAILNYNYTGINRKGSNFIQQCGIAGKLDIDKDGRYDKHLVKEISYQPEIGSFMDYSKKYTIVHGECNLFDIESKETKTICEAPSKMKTELSFISNNRLYYFKVSIESILIGVNCSILHELDLSSFELASHEIPHKIDKVVRISAWGCFVNYDNYVINSFNNGFSQSSDRLGWVPKSSDKTQTLDTQTWQDIESLPSLLKESSDINSNTNDSTDNSNLRAIVTGTIGGIIGLIVLSGIFLMFYRHKLKKEKLSSIIIGPIFINPSIHLDSNDSNISAIFSYPHKTMITIPD